MRGGGKTEAWGSDYQISVVIKLLATLFRMSNMEPNGNSERERGKTQVFAGAVTESF